jgi:hypothetical protein
VRVRNGTRDPDFPDVVLDGWTGVVTDIDMEETPPLCLVEWDEATRPRITEAVRERADKEGLEIESIWLGQDDLESTGEATASSAPVPAAPAEQSAPTGPREQRIRLALGLDANGPMPPVTPETLRAYHRHLAARLNFPLAGFFRLQLSSDESKAFPMTLIGLRPPEEAGRYGLLVEASLEGQPCPLPLSDCQVRSDPAVQELLEDHAAWFRGSAAKPSLIPMRMPELPEDLPQGAEEEFVPPQPMRRSDLIRLGGRVGAIAACAGGPFGAMLAAVPYATKGLLFGAGVMGLVGLLLGGRTAIVARRTGRMNVPITLAAILGACAGSFIGAIVGVLVVSFVGTIFGAIGGSLVGYLAARFGWRPLNEIAWAVLGAFVGGLVLATITDSEMALYGALAGVLIGGLGAILIFGLLLLGLAAQTPRE